MLLAIILTRVLDDDFRTSAFSALIKRIRINNKKGDMAESVPRPDG